ALFSWVAAQLGKSVDWTPDIIHAHDWPTGPVAAFVNQDRGSEKQPITIFTIHNLAYQGSMSPSYLYKIGLKPYYIQELIDTAEKDSIRYLRLGIKWFDKITTVSTTYAQEILTPEYGYGLEKDLRQHSKKIEGVVHGIDLDQWNPSSDSYIHPYAIDSLSEKSNNKTMLQKLAHFNEKEDGFLIGLVSRLVYQKGLDLLIDVIPELNAKDIQICILGTGESSIEKNLQKLQEKFPDRVSLFLEYNTSLSHKFIAGLDAFLLPSRYEPCGLTQLYAMQYGTIPITRKTGGLADTVSEDNDKQTGFVFTGYSSNEFLEAILRAYTCYTQDRHRWMEIQQNCMKQDLSWSNPAKKWEEIYWNALTNAK
ncbi:MAG: glycogen synthase, partial [Candidatus Kariarchaeaceae archaeon]